MQRSRPIRLIIALLSSLTALLIAAGCSHHAQPVPSPPSAQPVSFAQPTAGQPAAFQPYTLLPTPPPAPPVVTHQHRLLHLIRRYHRVYLADSDRRLYEAGRDTQGHIYPVYRDPATHAAYPLYYDSARDNLYRVARNDDGHYYRNYVGQPTDRFYAMEQDPERFSPSDNDRPVVTDSYNTYNYNTYNYGNSAVYHSGYRPPPMHHVSHHNNDWLWAIPVIVGVYFLLQPHHHYSPPNRQPSQTTVIVRQTTPITISNQNAPVYRPIYTPPPPRKVGYIAPQAPVLYRPLAVHRTRFVPSVHPAYRFSPRQVAMSRPAIAAPIRRIQLRPRQIIVAEHRT